MGSYRSYNRTKNVSKYCADLEKQGAKFLSDDGMYSSVYIHPTKKNTVIKVSTFEFNSPDGWFHYARFLIKNKINSPHAPKIYTLSKYKNMYVATMERLKPCYNIKGICNDLDFIESRLSEGIYDGVSVSASSLRKNGKPLSSKHKSLKRFIDVIIKHKLFKELEVDIHNDNVMIRRKVLVITDPFSDTMRV